MTTPMRNVEHLPYLLLLHCCRLGWLCITAWLQIGLRRKLSSLFPQRSQHYSNSCESNSSCFTASSWWHRKIMDKPRKNMGKSWNNTGNLKKKTWNFSVPIFFLSSFALVGFHLGFEKASEATLSKALQTSVKVGKSQAILRLAWSSKTVGSFDICANSL